MTGAYFGQWPLLLGAFLVLTACEDGIGPFGGGEKAERPARGQGGGPDRKPGDVEAPEVFGLTETGLWDGRPSLGGVWVAHPQVTTPERVLITNLEGNKSVVGALFRRERENPGPRFQLSSDAASELGILAGQPTNLRVVALQRTEEQAPPPAADAAAEGETPTPAEGEGEADTAVAADAMAAIGADGAAAPAAAEPQPVPEDGSPSSFSRRRPAPAPAPQAPAPDVTLAAPELETETLPPVGESAPAAEPAAEASADIVAEPSPALEAALADPQPVAEDRPASSMPGRRRSAEAEAQASVVPLDPSLPAAEPVSSLGKPYLQAATFSSEANAIAAAEKLRAANIPVDIRPDGTTWRLLAGPVATEEAMEKLTANVRASGYRDAFAVAN